MASQQQYVVTLRNMTDHIRRQKPNVDPNNARDWINHRIRSVLNRKVYWSGTIKRGVLAIPASYSVGTIALTLNSTLVTGTATAWPISDKANTIAPGGVKSIGMQTIVPASMTGIDADTMLYVDSDGTPEIVAVIETTRTAFRANFVFQHDLNCTLTSSSLVGRQLRTNIDAPPFTIRSVTSDTTLEIDNPWSDTSVDSTGYSIVKMYYTLAPDIKEIIVMADLNQQSPMRLHVNQEELNMSDPRRSATGPGYALADHSPNENGNMQYEIYPSPTSARQLPYMYAAQAAELKSDGDRPPSFINPNVFLYGALGIAFKTASEPDDKFLNPKLGDYYAMESEKQLQEAMLMDESKAQQQYSYHHDRSWGGGGMDWAQTHDVASYGGRWW